MLFPAQTGRDIVPGGTSFLSDLKGDVAMIDYQGWGSPPPPRRRRRGGGMAAKLAGVLCLVVVLAVLADRAFASKSQSPSATATNGQGQADANTTPGGAWTLGACLDTTTSLIPSFAPMIRSDLAHALASLAPPGTQVPTSAPRGKPLSPAQNGVNLTVREVDTNSYSSTMAAYTRNVIVPAVPGLVVSRPAPGSTNYVDRLRIWSQDYQTVVNARKNAAAKAAGASSTIASMPFDRNGMSAISACVSALLVTVPPGGNQSFLLASDLEENATVQLHGSFHGANLYIVQACDAGNGYHCAQLLNSFTKEMKRLDVGQVISIRPEDAAQAIDNWINTGQATP